jgi:hypothetical protein
LNNRASARWLLARQRLTTTGTPWFKAVLLRQRYQKGDGGKDESQFQVD